jgi:hypothetical protein
MIRARALRRRSLGFATACTIVRVSDADGLSRALADAIDPQPRPTRVASFLADADLPAARTPHAALRRWAWDRGLGSAGRTAPRRAAGGEPGASPPRRLC